MDAAVVQVSKPVRNSRHYDSAPVQPLHIEGKGTPKRKGIKRNRRKIAGHRPKEPSEGHSIKP